MGVVILQTVRPPSSFTFKSSLPVIPSNTLATRNAFAMFLLAFIMLLLFSPSAAATAPISKRSTHSTSSHHAIIFVLIFIATLIVLALLAFIVYRVFIKGRWCIDATPRFIPRKLLLRTDMSSNQSSDLEKGSKGQKVLIGPISSPVLLFGTGSMVLDPDAIREAKDIEGVGVMDALPLSKKHGAVVGNLDAQGEALGSPTTPNEIHANIRPNCLDGRRSFALYTVDCRIMTDVDSHGDAHASEPAKSHYRTRVATDPSLVRPIESDTTLVVALDSQNNENPDQPTNHPLSPVKSGIFVINSENGSNGEGLTEKNTEALGNVAEPCDDDITIRTETRATFAEKFNTYYYFERGESLARPATTRVTKAGFFDHPSSSLDTLNIRDMVDSTKSGGSEETFSHSRAEDERNVTTSLSSAFSMSDIADDDTLPAQALNSQHEAIDSPTHPREGHLQTSRSSFGSKEDAQAFLRICRVDMQRNPDVHVLIVNPASKASGSNDRASMPACQAPSLSTEPESTQKVPQCSSKRSSVMAYRPVLSSPLASDSEGCGLRWSDSFSRLGCSMSHSAVCDNNSASELLVDVLRRSYIDGMFTRTYNDLQRLDGEDDLFHRDEVPRPESPLFFEFDVNSSRFGPEVIDALSSNSEAKSFYVDDDSVEPMEIASTSWLADTTMVDATLDSTTPVAARTDSVLCKDTEIASHDPDISRPATRLSERVMRSSSIACARLPTLSEESEEEANPSVPPVLTTSNAQHEEHSFKELPAERYTLSARRSFKASSPSSKTLGKEHGSRARASSVSTGVALPSPRDNLPCSPQAQPTTPITKIRRGPPAAGLARQNSATNSKRGRSVSNSLSTKSPVGPTKPPETSRARRRSLSDISNLAKKSSSYSIVDGQSRSPVPSPRSPSDTSAGKSSSAAKPIKSSPLPSPPQTSPPPIPPRRRRSSTLSSPSPATRDTAPAIKKS